MSAGGEPLLHAARGWIGTPYVHQAAAKGAGCDCLGLIRGLWRERMGAEPEAVPPYSMDWSEPQGEEQLWAAALRHMAVKNSGAPAPGDVLLFRMRHGAVAKHLGLQARIDVAMGKILFEELFFGADFSVFMHVRHGIGQEFV